MRTILPVDGAPLMRQRVFFTLRKDGFELVPTDQNLPRLDGFGPTKQLRGSPDFQSVPILILTTESSDEKKQAGRAAGARSWLVKLFDPARPIEVIGKVTR